MSRRKRKAFEQVRVGLLDHLPLFAGCPDAFLLFMQALLLRELDGPECGNYYVHQADIADHLGWTRKRVRRAVQWLLENPAKGDPYLLLVKRGTRGRAACYHINRAGKQGPDCGSDRTRIHDAIVGRTGPQSSKFLGQSDPESQADKGQSMGPYGPETTELGTVKGPYGPRNTPISRARLKEPDEEEPEGSDAMKEVGDWVIVKDENEARQVLMHRLGMSNIEDRDFRDSVIEKAMQNLQHYHIAFEDDDDQEAIDNIVELRQPAADDDPPIEAYGDQDEGTGPSDTAHGEAESDAWEMPF